MRVKTVGKESARRPADILEEALTFFGPGGVGLTVMQRGDNWLRFEGAGGYVRVVATADDAVDGTTSVAVESREWEEEMNRFMEQLS